MEYGIELFDKISDERKNEICDLFIKNSIVNGKAVTEDALSELSFGEIMLLYANTEWFMSAISSDNREIGEKNRTTFYRTAFSRLERNPF